MDALVELDGAICRIPASGEIVSHRGTDRSHTLRWIGFESFSRADLVAARHQRILSLVPVAPNSVTVADLADRLPDIARDTIYRVLRTAQRDGAVISLRPTSQNPGNVSRHWMRVTVP